MFYASFENFAKWGLNTTFCLKKLNERLVRLILFQLVLFEGVYTRGNTGFYLFQASEEVRGLRGRGMTERPLR